MALGDWRYKVEQSGAIIWQLLIELLVCEARVRQHHPTNRWSEYIMKVITRVIDAYWIPALDLIIFCTLISPWCAIYSKYDPDNNP